MSKPSFLNSSSASDQFTIKTDTLPFRFGSGVLPATEQLYHKLVLIVPNHNRPNFRVTLLFLKLSTKITGSSPKWRHLLSYNPFNKEMQTWLKPISIRNMYLYNQKYSSTTLFTKYSLVTFFLWVVDNQDFTFEAHDFNQIHWCYFWKCSMTPYF